MYGFGTGETCAARNVLRQAWLSTNGVRRLAAVVELYRMRFDDTVSPGLNLGQIRGMERVRVRQAYAGASGESGVPSTGRSDRRDQLIAADPFNRALAAANGCLYGICNAAIVWAGYSPALGFVHTGKMLSLVYDIADLYKTEITIPAALHAAAEASPGLQSRVRKRRRDGMRESRILQRIIPDNERAPDIERALGAAKFGAEADFDAEPVAPGWLWDYERGGVRGAVNRADGAEPKFIPDGSAPASDASELTSEERFEGNGDSSAHDDY
ncbi:MAG TPA: CRISPR-associated endonuclease Cas1 [Armatimonadota bacterium]|nr:CRISPR-associated endonuclease Cas1 [Armatimonadota bacterium]